MVKFAKDGSTVVTAAVKLARAHTGRSKVAICAEHPFFSYNDWFIVTTGMPGGIPPEAASETLSFHYNDLAGAERLFAEHGADVAQMVAGLCLLDTEHQAFIGHVDQPPRLDGRIAADRRLYPA